MSSVVSYDVSSRDFCASEKNGQFANDSTASEQQVCQKEAIQDLMPPPYTAADSSNIPTENPSQEKNINEILLSKFDNLEAMVSSIHSSVVPNASKENENSWEMEQSKMLSSHISDPDLFEKEMASFNAELDQACSMSSALSESSKILTSSVECSIRESMERIQTLDGINSRMESLIQECNDSLNKEYDSEDFTKGLTEEELWADFPNHSRIMESSWYKPMLNDFEDILDKQEEWEKRFNNAISNEELDNDNSGEQNSEKAQDKKVLLQNRIRREISATNELQSHLQPPKPQARVYPSSHWDYPFIHNDHFYEPLLYSILWMMFGLLYWSLVFVLSTVWDPAASITCGLRVRHILMSMAEHVFGASKSPKLNPAIFLDYPHIHPLSSHSPRLLQIDAGNKLDSIYQPIRKRRNSI